MKKIYLLAFLVFFSFSYGVFNYSSSTYTNGDDQDYTEAMLDLSFSGNTATRVVVAAASIVLTNNKAGVVVVNGTLYNSQNSTTLTSTGQEDNLFFISYEPGNPSADASFTGSNNWTLTTHTAVTLPYTQTSTTSAFYEVSDVVDSVITSGLDLCLINNTDYTNSTVTSMPAQIGGKYYIYYGSPASGSPNLKIRGIPNLNIKVFLEGGLW